MKNHIAAIITIVFLICPSICFSSYLIELKNGSTFIINHYWKEDNQIKFYYSGGVVGIEKKFVKAIRKSDIVYKEKIDEYRPTPKDSESKNKLSEDKLNIDDYKNKKISFVARLKNHQEKMERDISRGKAKMWIERRRRKIKDIRIEIDNLAKEIMEKNNGILPDWWHEIAIPEQSETQ